MAAETSIWTGNVDGIWATAGNWTNTVPASTDDTAIIPLVASNDITGNDQGGKDIGKIHIVKGSTVAVGSAGSPLLIAAEKIIHEGSKGLYIQSDKGGTSLDIQQIWIMCTASDVPVVIGSATDAGDVDNIYLQRGNVTLEANLISAGGLRVEVGYMENLATDATLTVTTGVTGGIVVLRQSGGRIVSNAGITDGFCSGGTLTQDKVKITALETGGSHVLNYKHKAVTGDGTTLRIGGNAKLDLTGAQLPDAAYVLTTLWLRDRAQFVRQKNLHTVTNINDLRLDQD